MKRGEDEPRRLSAARTFVLQVGDVGPRTLTGRVEHVPSAQAIHFESVEQLVAFVDRVVTPRKSAQEEH